ncbi:thiamine diphosphokinase [Paenibacillus sp. JSM ZJ436]|uniref:Thiamine diphosphokinase n=1 Tax=Paenibacillus algicola TaxID=2565926 RepID=A0A4P8XML5_9BACL|nr:thiamine diphosphokinase [Paenibacillus algicola]QCT02781.1 thiamine pyrophosphokinase [Paenibacillus algicola]
MSSDRIVIVTGGQMSPALLEHIEDDDFLIGADRGALYLIEHGLTPHIALGDFDSVTREEMMVIQKNSGEVWSCDPISKDLTDTEMAFNLAIDRSPKQILIIGGTGTRMDHTLANIQMLVRGVQHHIDCSILDLHNFITLTGSSCSLVDRGYTYVSILPITHEVTGIHLEGFQYPLHNATVKLGQSLGISNRFLDKVGHVSIESGLLLIIQSKDA